MKKILKISLITLLVLLLLLIISPFLFKGKIIQKVRQEANKNLNATLHFDDEVSISIFKSFPDLHLGLKSFSIVGKDSFSGDTLISVSKLSVSLNIMSIIKGSSYTVNKIELEKPKIHLLVLPGGRANWDISIPDTAAVDEDTTSAFKLALKKLSVSNGQLIYDDQSIGFYTSLKDFNHDLKGDFTSDRFMLETLTDAVELTLGYGGIHYLHKVRSTIKANIDMDMKDMKFTFSENDILLNDLGLEINGLVDMNDEDMVFDLSFASKKTDFKNIISLVPGVFTKDFGKAKASGKLAFDGYLKGKMTETAMPGYAFRLKVDNGFFQYPDLPKSLNQVYVDLDIVNPGGSFDDTKIDLKRFDAVIAGEQIRSNLSIRNPESNMHIDGGLKGGVNLGEIKNLLPLSKTTQLSGRINADVLFKGLVSTLEKGNYEQFYAEGSIQAQQIIYSDPIDMPDGFQLKQASLLFNPSNISVPVCEGKIGLSDFALKGTVGNAFGYLLRDDLLAADLNFYSSYFNANQFLSDEEVVENPASSDTLPLQAFEVPTNLNIQFQTKVDKLIYDNLTMTDLNGIVSVKDGKIKFTNVGVNTLGGNIGLNGNYDSKNPKFPFSDMALQIKHLDIIQTYQYFDMVKTFAPIAKYTSGLFNADVKLANNYNPDMSVNYPSVSGIIQMGLKDAKIKDLPVLNMIAEKLKIFKMSNLTWDNLNLKFKIDNGKMSIDSIVLPLWNGAKAKISGYTALDQSIQYVAKMSIPRSDFGQANVALDNLLGQAKSSGLNLDVSKMVDVDVIVGGFFTSPKVSVSLHDAKKNLIGGVQDQLKSEFAAGKKAAEDEARKQMDLAKKKTQDSINAITKKVQNELKAKEDAARKQAQEEEELLKKEAEKAVAEEKAKAKEKTKSELDKLFKKK